MSTNTDWYWWRPEHGETVEDRKQARVDAWLRAVCKAGDKYDAQRVAETLLEQHHSNWDFLRTVVLDVQHDASGRVYRVVVNAIPIPSFEADSAKLIAGEESWNE